MLLWLKIWWYRLHHRLGEQESVAAEALADLRAVEPLIKELSRGGYRTKSAAAKALGALGDPRAVEPLINSLREEEWSDARSAIAHALGMLGDPRAVEPLIVRLVDEDSGVRRSAAVALSKLGEPSWATIVKGDERDFARLATCGDPRAVEPLIRAFRGEQKNVRVAAADALGELGDPRAVEPLISALGDENPTVRRAAAEALAKLGQPKWQAVIVGQLDDFLALGRSGDARLMAPLTVLLVHGNRDVRTAAAHGLIALAHANPVEVRHEWPAIAATIRTAHFDGVLHSDGHGGFPCSRHGDSYDTHEDRGVGLDFPDPPQPGASPPDGRFAALCPECRTWVRIPVKYSERCTKCPHCTKPFQAPRIQPVNNPSSSHTELDF